MQNEINALRALTVALGLLLLPQAIHASTFAMDATRLTEAGYGYDDEKVQWVDSEGAIINQKTLAELFSAELADDIAEAQRNGSVDTEVLSQARREVQDGKYFLEALKPLRSKNGNYVVIIRLFPKEASLPNSHLTTTFRT